jgi:hypothetical protein
MKRRRTPLRLEPESALLKQPLSDSSDPGISVFLNRRAKPWNPFPRHRGQASGATRKTALADAKSRNLLRIRGIREWR